MAATPPTAAPAPPSPPSPPTRRRFRFARGFAKTLAWFLFAIVFLILAALAFLQTDTGRELVRGLVVDLVNDGINGRIEVDRLEGTLPFDVTLRGVRIFDPDGGRALSVEVLTADVHPFALLGQTVKLSDIHIVGPDFRLLDDKGGIGLVRAFEPRVPSPDDPFAPVWTIELERIHLERGMITDLIGGSDVRFEDTILDLSLQFGEDGLAWRSLVLSTRPGAPLPPEITIRSRGSLVGDELILRRLTVQAGPHTLALDGRLRLSDIGPDGAGLLNLRSLTIDLEDLPEGVSPLPLTGRLELAGQVELADGLLTTSLTAGSTLGRLELQLGVDFAATPLRYEGTVRFDDLYPGALPIGLPEDFLADGIVAFQGVGDPRSPHSFELSAELVEQSPNPGGRLALTLVQPEGAAAGQTELYAALFNFDVEASDLDLDTWLAAFGHPDLHARLIRLDASGQLVLPLEGNVQLVAGGDLDVSARGRPAGVSETLEAEHVYSSFELQWDGAGLPTGDVAATVVATRFGDAGVDFADVSALLSRGEGDRTRIRGNITVQDAHLGSDIAIGRATAPFDVQLPDLAGPPEGSFDLEAGDVRVAGQRVGELGGAFRVRRAQGGLRVAGTFDARRLASDAGARAARASGTVDTWLGYRGQLDGEANVALTGLVVPGAIVGSAQTTVRVDARRGLRAGATLVGSFGARAISAGAVHAASVDGDFDLGLDGSGPIGQIRAQARGIRVDDCVGERACVIDRVGLDGQIQPGGKLAYDIRVTQRELEATFLGVLTLPIGRALQVDLDRFTLAHVTPGRVDGPPRAELMVIERARYMGDGVIRILDLRVVAPPGATGTVRARGVIDPVARTFDLSLVGEDLGIAGWLERYTAFADLLLAADPDDTGAASPFALALPDIGGSLQFGGYLRGTFADPIVRITVTLANGRVDDLDGINLGATLEWADFSFVLGLGGTWHREGTVNGHVRLPIALSFAPLGVTVDEDAVIAVSLDARDGDLTATQKFLTGVGAGGRLAGKALAGKARLTAEATGLISQPAFKLEFDADPLSIGAFEEGKVHLAVESQGSATRVALALDGPPLALAAAVAGSDTPSSPGRKPLVRFDLVTPIDLAELIGAERPADLLRERLRVATPATALLRLHADRVSLAETPLEAFVSGGFRNTEIAAQLSVTGPLPNLALESSRVELTGLGYANASLLLELREDEGDLAVLVTGSTHDNRVFRGSLLVPAIGELALDPSDIETLLEDPRLRLTLFSDDMTAGELWDFNQQLGEIATRFMPDTKAMVHVNARGAVGGPTANVLVRLRNARSMERRGDALDRNIADDLRLVVSIDADRTTVALSVTQDGADHPGASPDRPARALAASEVERVPPDCSVAGVGGSPFALAVSARADLGTRRLLRGEVPAIGTLPLDARIHACGLQLGRIGRALGAMFGPSRGRLDGRVVMTGTLDAPHFDGELIADFKQLDIDTIGFHRDRFIVGLTFEPRAIALTPIRLEGTPAPGRTAAQGAESYLELGLRADIDRLDPRGIRLAGKLEMRDFPLVDTRDANARVAGDIVVSGTLARASVEGKLEVLSALYQREFGGRSIRPLGLPEDVTLVVGDPVPPEREVVVTPTRTGARIDVSLEMREGRVVIENDMLRILPWTRDLRLRTIAGELVITGTIFVPQEKIELYGKTFRLTEDSRVVFTGDMRTDPQLLITATYDLSAVDLSAIGLATTPESRATVRVTGNAESPRLALSSDPPMDEANIVNVIVFDAPVGQGEGEDSAVRNQVANLVIGLATGSMARFVTDQLPIDTFQLDTRSGDLSESRLTIGKRIARNLFFRYRRNIGASGERESANEFQAEYRVGPVTLLGNYGDIGEFSLEANLRLRD